LSLFSLHICSSPGRLLCDIRPDLDSFTLDCPWTGGWGSW